jgi:predicted NBD/HSP70 family sugar kinase
MKEIAMVRTKLPPTGAAALRELCRHGELTRRELQGLLEVSGPTITRTVSHLGDLGLLTTNVAGDGALGRPAEIIRLSADGLCVIAVSLTATGTTVTLASIAGEIVEAVEADVTAQVPYETAIERIGSAVRALVKRARAEFRATAGVGISFGGAASFGEGRLTTPSGFPQWHGRAIAADVETETGLAAFVDNQPVGYLRALHWYDAHPSDDRYLCFADYGIAGCANSEAMPRPDRGVSTGGFGHVGGRLVGAQACWCGLYDCLNTRASLRGLRMLAHRRGLVSAEASEREAVAALESDEEGHATLAEAGRELVATTIDACRVLGTSAYVLGGALLASSPTARAAAEEAIRAHLPHFHGGFLPAVLVERGPVLSAAAILADGMALSGRIETFPPTHELNPKLGQPESDKGER